MKGSHFKDWRDTIGPLVWSVCGWSVVFCRSIGRCGMRRVSILLLASLWRFSRFPIDSASWFATPFEGAGNGSGVLVWVGFWGWVGIRRGVIIGGECEAAWPDGAVFQALSSGSLDRCRELVSVSSGCVSMSSG